MYLNKASNYDKEPTIKIEGYDQKVWQGYTDVVAEIKQALNSLLSEKNHLVVETYPGVRKDEVLSIIGQLNPALVIDSDEIMLDDDTISSMISRTLTDDRVFGSMSYFTIDEFIDTHKLMAVQEKIRQVKSGIVIVHGFGASKIVDADVLIYADLARWEIQQRYRSREIANWKANNHDEDILRKYKRGFFFEWRMADRLKKELFEKMDYLLDTNLKDDPKMVTREAFLDGLNQVIKRPFRVVPYFDPGVWGGQWMKEVCGLDPEESNYAWSFDGVPEENSLYMKYGNVRIEVPALDLVFYKSIELLGEKVYSRFGAEFPIRFNFLDTMGGQNLSLQVHPVTEYIQDKFGMPYTQDESYYILDGEDETYVYLGLKDDIDKDEMMRDLRRAQDGEISFPDEKYINKISAKKHDHFLIPAGTIHCSGKGSMVLEVSSSKYIFTFKLWDWGRLGLDGKPRPVHIDHGEKVINWNQTSDWVEENLVNQFEHISSSEGFREERTGLHKRQFIETRRHWFTEAVHHETNGSVNMLNLVEGEEIIVKSPTNEFEPFIIHYAETFIIPAHVKSYTIKPHGPSIGKKLATIKAFVRC